MTAEKKLQNWILSIVIIVIAVAVPLFKVAQGTPVVSQGIDLVGGVDLLLQAQVPEDEGQVTADMMLGAINIVRNRLDPEGVKEITIQRLGDDRIVVQIPNEDDPERVKKMIGETAVLYFIDMGSDPVDDGTKIVFVDPATGKSVGKFSWEEPPVDLGLITPDPVPPETTVLTEQILAGPSDITGIRIVTDEPSAPTEEIETPAADMSAAETDLTAELPDVPAAEVVSVASPEPGVVIDLTDEAAVRLPSGTATRIGQYLALVVDGSVQTYFRIESPISGEIAFPDLLSHPGFDLTKWSGGLARMKIVALTSEPALGAPVKVIDPTGQYSEDATGSLYEGRLAIPIDKIILTGDDFADASVSFSQLNQPQIAFTFEKDGKNIFGKYTAQNVGKFLAIALDDEIISCPRIREPILNGRGVIEGSFTRPQAQDLVVKLDSGRLPVPLKIIANMTVGPTLGAKSIADSKRAAVLGAVLVILFMIIYYRLAGITSAVALLYYGLIFFGALSILNATLTLPGIAGFIMSAGMAVDANVIIFERLKEELRTGKTFRSALDAAFKRAFAAIFDSNVTTLITALVLYNLGTGPIKGFAVTLSLGVIVSMYSSLIFTRLLLEAVLVNKNFQKYSLFGVTEADVALSGKGGGGR